jgi:hypothetical protein
MKTTRAVALLLKPESDGRVRLSLTGTVQEETAHERRTLLVLSSLWARPEPLRVALCADAKGCWEWTLPWTDALPDLVAGHEVRFVVRGGGRGHR